MSVAPARLAPARALPRPTRAATPQRPRLRLVAPHRLPSTPLPTFALYALILLAAMLGALALNTSMASTTYTITQRSAELVEVQQRVESLSSQLESASAPGQLQARAEELGMVASPGVTYVRLADRTLVNAPADDQ